MTTITPPTIKRLDQTVVNRIAAGEANQIIHRPANALKELIENSLDAGSTQIQILVKDGGLKLLQIQDNGHGIRREDMPIVCERFTTSKLSKFEDLSGIATHGFRGEALASISHVAHVTITTKTRGSKCAFRANYSDGKLVPPRPGQSAEPKPCAGNDGTQITAEDLFYNVATRRKALKFPSEEYNRILDVVTRYAIHNPSHGGVGADIQTSSAANVVDNIRQLYGSSVASELLHVEREFSALGFKMEAQITNANYHVKRLSLLLFINHRSVENMTIKRMIENVYSALLPKGTHPFVYLSLEIDPKNVDVNVHPTKRETLLPGVPDIPVEIASNQASTSKLAPYKQVRTDSKMNTLDTFVYANNPYPSSSGAPKRTYDVLETSDLPASRSDNTEDVNMTERDEEAETLPQEHKRVKRVRTDVRLTRLTEIFANHSFVACVDDTLALIQHETNLYLVNFSIISEELFYQIVLSEFENFGVIYLSSPASIEECVMIALDAEEKQGNLPARLQTKENIARTISDNLVARAEMLEQYFSMKISEDGNLLSLPMLLRGYTPTVGKLPMFLLRLGTEVNWEEENPCFEGIARELAMIFCAEPPLNTSSDEEYEVQHKRYLWQVQHLIFPSLKSNFSAPTSLVDANVGNCVTKLASLSDLYKIFERC
ncbi:DNA mismatch repair protein [Apophysomyces ossiformis]|uniref:DNA mismatch repair protein n=1 Tax=Apophysomyces ossiformis TaxID=679940 RepID=A0A8H7EVC0_9FUNG|nr:DNA mismatch repair protein [Apophysomyces ossiformis]